MGILASTLILGLLTAAPLAAEEGASWPEWRGPNRDGIVPRGPGLASRWPEDGPPKVWHTEGLPSGGDGGYGSPVVAGGRVYLYVNWRYRVPLATRKLSDSSLRRLGWISEKPPENLQVAVEQARMSAERRAARDQDLHTWVSAWIDGHLDETQMKRFGSFIRTRLMEGEKAIPLDTLGELATMREHVFPDQAALDRWFEGHGITGDLRTRILSTIPTEETKTKDVVVCLDAATGRTHWRTESPGSGGGASSTICVARGRCYGITSTREAFCLDAQTGREIWKARCGGGHSSFLVEDGLAVVLADPLTAFDAATGAIVWTQPKVRGQENSAVRWKSGGATYLICNTPGDVACVDLKSGEVRWTAEGGGPSTAAVAENHMAILTNKDEAGLIGYRISPERAERLWGIPRVTDRGSSPVIHDGHVYAVAGSRTICAGLASGQIAWEGRPGQGDICSPIIADGLLLAVLAGRTLAMMRASPKGYELLGKVRLPMSPCASPAMCNGMLYVRMSDGLACFDLTER